MFDFTGTGTEVWGNCNAPRAITLSALIYCLRCMVGQDIPLNQVMVVRDLFAFFIVIFEKVWRTKNTHKKRSVPFLKSFFLQGCLAPISVVIPSGSILQPSQNAAVVGGNVLTSQRVVDVIFKAFEVCSASQVRSHFLVYVLKLCINEVC